MAGADTTQWAEPLSRGLWRRRRGGKGVQNSSDGCADHWGIAAAGGRSPEIVDAPRRELEQVQPQMAGADTSQWAEPPSRVLWRRRRGGRGVRYNTAAREKRKAQ